MTRRSSIRARAQRPIGQPGRNIVAVETTPNAPKRQRPMGTTSDCTRDSLSARIDAGGCGAVHARFRLRAAAGLCCQRARDIHPTRRQLPGPAARLIACRHSQHEPEALSAACILRDPNSRSIGRLPYSKQSTRSACAGARIFEHPELRSDHPRARG